MDTVGIAGRRVEDELSVEEKRAIQQAGLRVQARERFPDAGRLKPAGRVSQFLAGEDGSLYQEVRVVEGMPAQEDNVVAFSETPSGNVLWLRRPPFGQPQTLSDLEDERRERRARREQGEAERLRKLEKTPRSPVTAGELIGVEFTSLRAAAHKIEASGGKVFVKRNGELVVELPERGRAREEGLDAARLLFSAPKIVIAALGTKLGADSLPSRDLRAGE